jgi:hypothetical protein
MTKLRQPIGVLLHGYWKNQPKPGLAPAFQTAQCVRRNPQCHENETTGRIKLRRFYMELPDQRRSDALHKNNTRSVGY